MCGIVGIMNLSGNDDYTSTLNMMMDRIYNRGPDSGGSYINENIFLGMRRLSIMDEEGGDQPFSFNNNEIQVIFNGEIYNYHKLRNELESNDYIFATNCDTEIIGYAYQYYGDDFASYLDGMFAIALWDDKKKSLYIVRDRLGIKPLYYFHNNGKFVFGSNIKSILACPFVSKDVNYAAMSAHLTKRFSNNNNTIFKGIHKIPPGNILKLNCNEKVFSRYWDLNSSLKNKIIKNNSVEEKIYDYRNNFEYAVSSHLMSDVPVGAFLSGGIDSSSIVALMSKHTDSKINTYSVGFSKNSEIVHSRKVAEYFNTNHQELLCEAPSFDDLIHIFYELEEPVIDPAIIPTYFVSKLASKDLKVVLTGEGSDEINGGYSKYIYSSKQSKFPFRYLNLLSLKQKNSFLKYLGKYNNRISRYLEFYISKSYASNQLYDFVDSNLMWKGSSNNIFLNELLDNVDNLISAYESSSNKTSSVDILQNHFYNDLIDGWLTNQLLLKVDKMSMAYSLEARVPFLDHNLLESALLIPANLKIKENITKSVFRDSIKNLIPNEIINRRQHGFLVPIDEWFNNEWSNLLNFYLIDGSLMNSGVFNIKSIKNIVSNSNNLDPSINSLLWSLLSLELWYEAHFK